VHGELFTSELQNQNVIQTCLSAVRHAWRWKGNTAVATFLQQSIMKFCLSEQSQCCRSGNTLHCPLYGHTNNFHCAITSSIFPPQLKTLYMSFCAYVLKYLSGGGCFIRKL
jgi:hypothetical protein